MVHEVFFRPRPHWVGDVIPYADDERIRLYYLTRASFGDVAS